jgi:hypothetical protein
MSLQYMTSPATPDRKPATFTKDARNGRKHQLSVEQSASVNKLLQQLFESLTVLGNTSDLALTGKTNSPDGWLLRVNLHPNARQAEAAMHELRNLRLTNAPVLTDLSQSLTVLVLAADMISQEQLSGSEALSFYGLLQRNADLAMSCLSQLYSEFGLETNQAE